MSPALLKPLPLITWREVVTNGDSTVVKQWTGRMRILWCHRLTHVVYWRHPGWSLLMIKHNNGPKIDACGTPQLINWSLDTQVPSTHCWPFDRYVKTSHALNPSDSRAEAFSIKSQCRTVWRAFREIKKHNQISRAFVNVKIPAMCKSHRSFYFIYIFIPPIQ